MAAAIALASLCIAATVDASPVMRPVEDYQQLHKRAATTTKAATHKNVAATTAHTTTAKAASTHKAVTSTHKASASAVPHTSSKVLSSASGSQSVPSAGMLPTASGVNPSLTSTATPTASNASPNAGASSGLSGAAIGGIVAVSAVAVIGIGAFAFIRNKRRRKSPAPSYPRSMRQSIADPFSMGFVGASKPQPQMPSQDNPFPAAATYERLEEPKSLGVYNVVSTYTPTLGDEIDIRSGDRIRVLVEYDDGWMLGENLSNGDAKGVFPRHCIDYPGNESYAQPMYTDDQRPDSMLHVNADNRRSKRISSLYSAHDMK
ncbi:hypothetical protein Unana1_02339 [Umbelopsis nana]